MRSLIVASLLVTAILSGCVAVDAKKVSVAQLPTYTFEQYKKDFKKTYVAGTEEHAMREKVFKQRLLSVLAHNADATRTYTQGVNHLTDTTDAERKNMMGNRPHMKAAVGDSANMKSRVPAAGLLPKSIDYRLSNPPVLTAVKDQGQCGSCWAHAAVEGIESMWAIATGELFVMSQQQITSCTPNPEQCGGTGGCSGAIAELAYDHVVTVDGIQQEWTYPYTSYFGDSHFPSCVAKLNQSHAPKVAKLTGYTKATMNDAHAVAEALVNAGPLAVSVDASHWFEYHGGVFNGCPYAKNISMDHAVQLVGYGHDYTNSMDYWIIRNSWSPGWGEDGFIRLNRPNVTQCGWNVHNQDGGGCKNDPSTIRACGTCGIAWDAIYPNVKVA